MGIQKERLARHKTMETDDLVDTRGIWWGYTGELEEERQWQEEKSVKVGHVEKSQSATPSAWRWEKGKRSATKGRV